MDCVGPGRGPNLGPYVLPDVHCGSCGQSLQSLRVQSIPRNSSKLQSWQKRSQAAFSLFAEL
eukprot:187936-Amphidinium_carterae.1